MAIIYFQKSKSARVQQHNRSFKIPQAFELDKHSIKRRRLMLELKDNEKFTLTNVLKSLDNKNKVQTGILYLT